MYVCEYDHPALSILLLAVVPDIQQKQRIYVYALSYEYKLNINETTWEDLSAYTW